jgi:hypothetical protein
VFFTECDRVNKDKMGGIFSTHEEIINAEKCLLEYLKERITWDI